MTCKTAKLCEIHNPSRNVKTMKSSEKVLMNYLLPDPFGHESMTI